MAKHSQNTMLTSPQEKARSSQDRVCELLFCGRSLGKEIRGSSPRISERRKTQNNLGAVFWTRWNDTKKRASFCVAFSLWREPADVKAPCFRRGIAFFNSELLGLSEKFFSPHIHGKTPFWQPNGVRNFTELSAQPSNLRTGQERTKPDGDEKSSEFVIEEDLIFWILKLS